MILQLASGETVGIRMPSHPIMHEVIEKSNIPLAAPSANISTKPSGTCIEDIREDFEGKVELIVDGGKCDICLLYTSDAADEQ